jgi:hypothetical protein
MEERLFAELDEKIYANVDTGTDYQLVRYSNEAEITGVLEATWPVGVLSLSHIALPFSPQDPLLGRVRPVESSTIYLGSMALRGETGLHRIPADWLLRMRYNPFYDSMESILFDWLDKSGGGALKP